MATWWANIDDSYTSATAAGMSEADAFDVTRLALFVEGNVVNGSTLINGDTIKVNGSTTAGGALFADCTRSFTVVPWDNGEPWRLTDVVYGNGYVSAALAGITMTFHGGVWAGIVLRRNGINMRACTLNFYNCAFYNLSARDTGANIAVSFINCSYCNKNVWADVLDVSPGACTMSFVECFMEDIRLTGIAAWGTLSFTRCYFNNSENASLSGLLPLIPYVTNDCQFDHSFSAVYPAFVDFAQASVDYLDFGLPSVWPQPADWNTWGVKTAWWNKTRFGYGAFYFLFDANINADPESGASSLIVNFNSDVPDVLVNSGDGYNWGFGDGDASNESSPVHTFIMPGEYNVNLIITSKWGDSVTLSITIYVYENSYSRGGRVVTKTEKCYRFAIPQEQITQGVGWSEYSGEQWPLPVGHVGCCKIMDINDEDIQLCVDSNTFYTYELGRDDWWVDGGNDEYGGADFEALILLRENVNPIGATSRLKHNQSRADFKAWWKDRRKTGLYNAAGFRDAFSVDLFVRKDSEPYDAAITKQVPLGGQLVFDRHIESQFLQMGLKVRGAPWRMTFAEQDYSSRDTGANPRLKAMSELGWSLQASEPLVWIGRDSGLVHPTLPINAGTGIRVTGSYAALTTGPDGLSRSAFAFGTADSFVANIPDYGDEFSLMMWLRSPTYPLTLWQSSEGGMRVVLATAGAGAKLEYFDDNNHFNIPLSALPTDWTMLSVVRRDDTLVAYENGVLINTYGLIGLQTHVCGDITMCQGSCAAWAMRMLPRVVTQEAMTYYYNDVKENAANATENIF